MQLFRVAAWGVAILIPTFAAAQSTTGTQTTNPPDTTTSTTQSTMSQPDPGMGWMDRVESHWLASAMIGSNSGAEDSDGAGFDFGANVGYLWRGVLGGEFLANFSPDFEMDPTRSILLSGEQPWVNTYMFNAMAAVPLGTEGRFQPYFSAGLGAMTLRADALVSGSNDNDFEPDDTRGAGNVGFGLMGYMHNVGVRADVRWFRGFDAGAGDANDDINDIIGRAILSDLSFWRANLGVAFKW